MFHILVLKARKRLNKFALTLIKLDNVGNNNCLMDVRTEGFIFLNDH